LKKQSLEKVETAEEVMKKEELIKQQREQWHRVI